MVSDFGAWAFLLSQMKGYSAERAMWNTIHPVTPLFPGSSVVFGDAGTDRLVLPLPFPFETVIEPPVSASTFNTICIRSLISIAREVQAGEKLIILLIGHGSLGHGGFRLHITTEPDTMSGEDYITKADLEVALQNCRGDIQIICNSCQSGDLASDRWTLLCPATREQPAESLSQSNSGYFRGSAFTACMVAQAALEHGIRVPLPRVVPRPVDVPKGQRVPLPSSPPQHSFSSPASAISIVQPPGMSFRDFLHRMVEMERYLIDSSMNVFQVVGSQSMVTWTSVLPIQFTEEIVERISLKADSVDYSASFNETAVLSAGPQGGPPPILTVSRSPQFHQASPRLVKLATAMSTIEHAPRTHDAIYADICKKIVQHISDPEQHVSPIHDRTIREEELLYVLLPMHVQAIAVQEIARVLGWHDGAKVPFFPRKVPGWKVDAMIQQGGVRVNEVPEYLERHYFKGCVKRRAVFHFNSK